MHEACGLNLYELRGDTVATLKWIKVDQQLTQKANRHPIGFPLPDKVNITCQQKEEFKGNTKQRVQIAIVTFYTLCVFLDTDILITSV